MLATHSLRSAVRRHPSSLARLLLGTGLVLLLLVSAVGLSVTAPEGYRPPSDHVPETGTYLPADGRPTLMFVDAIW
jgi:hypothetical protein